MLLTLAALLALPATLALPCPGATPCLAQFRVHPNGNKDYCLTVGNVNQQGAVATVQKCEYNPNGPQNFYWEIPADGSDAVHLRNVVVKGNNLCLAATQCDRAPIEENTQLSLQTCINDGGHTWYPIAGDGKIVTTGLLNNQDMCMDLRDGKLDGGAVQIYTCVDGNTNQQWTVSA